MEKTKRGGADDGDTAERQPQTVASSSVLNPKATASSMAQGGKATGLKRSASIYRSGQSPKTSLSVSRFSRTALSTVSASEDGMRPRSQTSLRRKRGTSTTAFKRDRTGEPSGESRDEIQSDFTHQMSILMQSPKAKATVGKPKPRVMVVFMPTYRLEPVHPLRIDHVEKIMGRVLENIVSMKYDEATIPLVVQALSKCIINVTRLPSCNTDRYKMACQVRIIEKKFQGYTERITALWAHEHDKVITAQVENHWMVATAILSACYFD